jgi:prolyl-tRNA synthetase
MKDSYSFDLDDAGLAAATPSHREAYQRIFDRLACSFAIAAAHAGAMGGSRSEEFLAPLAAGEMRSPAALRAWRLTPRRLTPAPPGPDSDGEVPPAHVEIPRHPDHRHPGRPPQRPGGPAPSDRPWTAADTLKNVVVGVRTDGRAELLAVGLPATVSWT